MVRLRPKAEKNLNRILEHIRDRIKQALVVLQDDPYLGKQLYGKFKNRYSINIWPYRIVYEVYKNILLIVVVDIDHRQGVYK